MTEAAGLAGRAGHWAALAWGAGQALGARLGVQGERGPHRRACVGRRQVLGRRRRRTGTQADAGKARRRAAGARGAAAGARGAAAGARGAAAGARGAAAGAQTWHGHEGVRGKGRGGRPAGRTVRVWCAQLGQVGCLGAPDSVFGPV